MVKLGQIASEVFKNDKRSTIVNFLFQKKDGAYISEVAKKLKISKGSAFANLGELEKARVVVHHWELTGQDKTPRAVKVYSIDNKLKSSEQFKRIFKEI